MQLDIRLDGFEEPIGLLSSSWATGATKFSYTQGYASREDALPLSLALPLSKKQFNDFDTRAYFDNLLQERDSARADIIAKYRLANDDIVGILFHMGKDCAGAVSASTNSTIVSRRLFSRAYVGRRDQNRKSRSAQAAHPRRASAIGTGPSAVIPSRPTRQRIATSSSMPEAFIALEALPSTLRWSEPPRMLSL